MTQSILGLDVHQARISAAVQDSTGKLVMESILETKAATILQFAKIGVQSRDAWRYQLFSSGAPLAAYVLDLSFCLGV